MGVWRYILIKWWTIWYLILYKNILNINSMLTIFIDLCCIAYHSMHLMDYCEQGWWITKLTLIFKLHFYCKINCNISKFECAQTWRFFSHCLRSSKTPHGSLVSWLNLDTGGDIYLEKCLWFLRCRFPFYRVFCLSAKVEHNPKKWR